jgi:hypothetical protein
MKVMHFSAHLGFCVLKTWTVWIGIDRDFPWDVFQVGQRFFKTAGIAARITQVGS